MTETAMSYHEGGLVHALEASASIQTENAKRWKEKGMVPAANKKEPLPFAFCTQCEKRGHYQHGCPQLDPEARKQLAEEFTASKNRNRERQFRGRGGYSNATGYKKDYTVPQPMTDPSGIPSHKQTGLAPKEATAQETQVTETKKDKGKGKDKKESN
jgi:hypothetical protein